MKDDIESLLFAMYLLCDSRLFLDFLTYPVIKHHLGVAVANKFIGVFWVEGYISLA